MKDVCVRVRQHLRAAAVAFVARLGTRADIVCGDGVRLDTAIAERAADRGHHHRAAPPRRSDRGGGAGPLRRRADRRALRALDAGHHRRHLARRLGADDERGGGGADGGGDDRAAAAGGASQRTSELLGVTPAMAELQDTASSAPRPRRLPC